jgi:hypothetical protein
LKNGSFIEIEVLVLMIMIGFEGTIVLLM